VLPIAEPSTRKHIVDDDVRQESFVHFTAFTPKVGGTRKRFTDRFATETPDGQWPHV